MEFPVSWWLDDNSMRTALSHYLIVYFWMVTVFELQSNAIANIFVLRESFNLSWLTILNFFQSQFRMQKRSRPFSFFVPMRTYTLKLDYNSSDLELDHLYSVDRVHRTAVNLAETFTFIQCFEKSETLQFHSISLPSFQCFQFSSDRMDSPSIWN